MKRFLSVFLCALLMLNAIALAEFFPPASTATDDLTYAVTFLDAERTDTGVEIRLRFQNLDVEALEVAGEMFRLAYADRAFELAAELGEVRLLPLEEREIALSYAVPEAFFAGDFGVFVFTVTTQSGAQIALDVLDALGLAVEGAPLAVAGGRGVAVGEIDVWLGEVSVQPAGSDSLKALTVTLKIANRSAGALDIDLGNLPEVRLSFRERYMFQPQPLVSSFRVAPGEEGELPLTFEVANAVAEAQEPLRLIVLFGGESAEIDFTPGEGDAAPQTAAAVFAEAGYRHSFALSEDGTLWAWGAGEYGRLGTGSTAGAYEPQAVKIEGAIAASAGWYHSLFLTSDGSVYAAGCNHDFGQLGDGSGSDRSIPVKVLDGAIQVAASADFSAALKADGTVWTWGRNDVGQLGLGNLETQTTPQQVALRDVVEIAVGEEFMAARTGDGRVYLWGGNPYGQLGDTQEEAYLAEPREIALDAPARDLALGNNHVLVLCEDGSLTAWGDDVYNQLGGGDERLNAFLAENGIEAARVEAGGDMCALLARDGAWYAWGDWFGGEITPIEQPSAQSLSLGYFHALAMEENGDLWGRGSNDYYQIGRVSEDTYRAWAKIPLNLREAARPSEVPKERDKAAASEPFAADAASLAAGYYTSFAIGANGEVWAWGRSDYGQLGAGGEARQDAPVKLSLEDVRQVAAGDYHTLFVTQSGALYGTGCSYDYDQLGTGDYRNADEPIKLMDGVARAWAGRDTSVALMEDGTLWAWGANDLGQLGLGHTDKVEGPARLSLEGVVDLAVGKQFMAALMEDGSVWTWGSNEYGQLGVNGEVSPGVPVKVELPGIVSIAAGGAHMIALDADGGVWAWGAGAYGQLGNGSATNQFTPVRVADAEGAVQVLAGGDTTAARMLGGQMLVWGAFFYSEPYPEQISYYNQAARAYEDIDIVQLSMGSFHVLATDDEGNVYALGDNSYRQLGADSSDSYYYYDWVAVGLNLSDAEYVRPAATPAPYSGHQALAA